MLAKVHPSSSVCLPSLFLRIFLTAAGGSQTKVEFVYTDISRQLVGYGRKTYGPRFPFAAFKFLDVEQPLEQQGFAVGQTDIVFATNVLHATRDMGATLQHCKALLKNGGLLIANELTTKTDFLTLTFGLTDGWWLYDDGHIRTPGSPIISRCASVKQSQINQLKQLNKIGSCTRW